MNFTTFVKKVYNDDWKNIFGYPIYSSIIGAFLNLIEKESFERVILGMLVTFVLALVIELLFFPIIWFIFYGRKKKNSSSTTI